MALAGAHIGILRHKSKCNPAAHNTPILSPCKIYNSGFYQTSRWRIRFLAMSSVSFETPLWSRLKYLINHLINCPEIHGPRRMKTAYFGDVTFLFFPPNFSSTVIIRSNILLILWNISLSTECIGTNRFHRCRCSPTMYHNDVSVPPQGWHV